MAGLGLAALTLVGPGAAPGHAIPLLATGTQNSPDITLTFTGEHTGLDATKIVVYPLLVVRTPPFYPVGSAGASEGCLGGTGSPNPGVSFGTTTFNGVTTAMVVTLQNDMAAGLWAVQIGSGAVGGPGGDDPGCVRFVVAGL